MENLDLWQAVERTPPDQTKEITGKSYRGNSPKPHYLVWKATETFGPCGIGWGFAIEDERIEEGAGGEKMHVARVKVWYKWKGERGEVEHIGGTQFSGTRSSGKHFTDEDAPKKSVTDALVKALSLIGFAGDIFMGRYDDSKYVQELRQEARAAKPTQTRVTSGQQSETPFDAPSDAQEKVARVMKDAIRMAESRADLDDWLHDNRAELDKLPEVLRDEVRDVYANTLRKLRQPQQEQAA